MSEFKRILCPTDFSATAMAAFRWAEKLAVPLQAEILLIHAFETPAALTMAGQSLPSDPTLRKKLDEVPTSRPDLAVRRMMHVGAPGETICWAASQEACDLIIIGTHGHTGWRQILLGSVAEYVVRHAPCPVLTVRLPSPDEPPPKEPRVLPLPAPRLM